MTSSVVPRPENGMLVVRRWQAPTPLAQRAALAAAAAWDLIEWPDGLERFVIAAGDDRRRSSVCLSGRDAPRRLGLPYVGTPRS